jgi:Sulfotransferase domain
MLILSVGMPKSGSAWYYNLTNDLLVAGGCHDARMIRDRYNLHPILKYGTCNIQDPTDEKLQLLTSPPIGDHTFVVKTHAPPTEFLVGLIDQGSLKATYVYRDPRDTAVSGYEEGRKLREKGKVHRGVTRLETMTDAIQWSESWLKRSWDRWKNVKGVLRVKYEDLLANPQNELERLASFLCVEVESDVLKEIDHRWRPERLVPSKGKIPLHFNKGVAGRFRKAMNPEEQSYCQERIGPYLSEMGYLA